MNSNTPMILEINVATRNARLLSEANSARCAQQATAGRGSGFLRRQVGSALVRTGAWLHGAPSLTPEHSGG